MEGDDAITTGETGREAHLEEKTLHFDLDMLSSAHVPDAQGEGLMSTQLEMWVWCSGMKSVLEKESWEQLCLYGS